MLFPFKVTHMLTISLRPHYQMGYSGALLTNSPSVFAGIARETINRLDRNLYGKRHNERKPESKFPFVGKIETVSRNGEPVPHHLHFCLSFWRSEVSRLQNSGDRLAREFRNSLFARGFDAQFHLCTHDGSNVDYILKYADHDLLGIFSRSHPFSS